MTRRPGLDLVAPRPPSAHRCSRAQIHRQALRQARRHRACFADVPLCRKDLLHQRPVQDLQGLMQELRLGPRCSPLRSDALLADGERRRQTALEYLCPVSGDRTKVHTQAEQLLMSVPVAHAPCFRARVLAGGMFHGRLHFVRESAPVRIRRHPRTNLDPGSVLPRAPRRDVAGVI